MKVGESKNPSQYDVDDEFDYDDISVDDILRMISDFDESIASKLKNYFNYFSPSESLNINRDKSIARNINMSEAPINVINKTTDFIGHTNEVVTSSTSISIAVVATTPLTNKIKNEQNITYAIKSYNVLSFFPFLSNHVNIRSMHF